MKTRQNITAKKAQEMVLKFNGKRCSDLEAKWLELSVSFRFNKIFELDNLKIVKFDEIAGGILYLNEDVMNQGYKELKGFNENEPQSTHILHNTTPFEYKPDFENYIDEYIRELATKLKMPLKKLDYSFKSLEILDTYILKNFGTGEAASLKLFPFLLAYVGQVIIKNLGGKWKIEYDSVDEVWEPNIELANGKILKLWSELLKDLDDDQEGGFSIMTTIDILANEQSPKSK